MLSQIRKRASRRGSPSKSNSESEGPSDGARVLDIDPYDLTRSETYRTEEMLEDEVRHLEEVKRRKKAGRMRNTGPYILTYPPSEGGGNKLI